MVDEIVYRKFSVPVSVLVYVSWIIYLILKLYMYTAIVICIVNVVIFFFF